MFETELFYNTGRKHFIEAGTMDMLKSKLEPFIEDDRVWVINIYKKEYVENVKGGN